MANISVFISSKMLELQQEREALFEFLPTLSDGIMHIQPWVFEKPGGAPASEDSIREIYLEALQNSALYIGLFWNQYGEYTIDEFERAGEWGIPRHIYVKDVDAHKREDRLRRFLEQHGDVERGLTAKWFKTLDELRAAVRESISYWLKNVLLRRTGAAAATRYDDAEDVPLPDHRLYGRDALIDEVQGALNNGQARVLLHGFGGAGKTTLARKIAVDWLEADKGNVLWLQVGASDAVSVFQALAAPFGAQAQKEVLSKPADEQHKVVRGLLKQVSLLVLDDAWDGAALKEVLKAVPRSLPLLVTARQRYPLRTILEVPDLPEDDALDLLRELAGEFAADESAGRDLVREVGRLAFAVELAGRTMQSSTYTSADLLQRIRDTDVTQLELPLDFAEQGRHSVAALLETSLNALPDEARRAFFAWGAFWDGSLTPELLADYDDSFAAANALTLLQQHGLAVRYLAQADDEGRPESAAYYRLHDLAFAYSHARATDEQREQALTACLSYTGRYNEPSRENFAALAPPLANFSGAATFAYAQGRYADAERFAWNLYVNSEVLLYRGYYQQALGLLEQAARAAEGRGDKRDQGAHLGHLGLAYSDLGQYEQAIEHYRQALAISREIDDRRGEGTWLGNLGSAYRDLGQYEQAIEHTQQALAIAEEIGDIRGKGNHLGNLGSAYHALGQYEQAIEHHQQALAIMKEIGAVREQGSILGNLGNAYSDLGQYEQAIEHHQQALAIAEEIGDIRGKGNRLGNLGNAYRALGQYEQAIDHYQQALAIAEEIGDIRGKGNSLGSLGNAYHSLGQYEQAIEHHQQALAIAEEIGDIRGKGNRLGNLGNAYRALGQYEQAIDHYQQALAIAEEIGDIRGKGNSLGSLGNAYYSLGQYEQALEHHQQALAIAEEIGDRRNEGIWLGNLGIAYHSLGQYEQAIDHYQQAKEIFDQLGNPHLITQIDGLIADVKRKIGGEA